MFLLNKGNKENFESKQEKNPKIWVCLRGKERKERCILRRLLRTGSGHSSQAEAEGQL